ncbi:carbohydrate ABC transporter permease [Maritalea myrionectae]|uniref:Alpha-glucoside transport system permease protein AglF n=1 Tax=Maritalea myrionectae TaxID=454601 RepID=A0A2R4MH25_9HYPH|nr:sugar ABC transporter permease [Maritalea myrionectae]AVX05351.1 alpha-glucoside transport system permease protein AglF [Maritalea myrionectae]
MIAQILSATQTVIIGVAACILYFWGTNWVLDRLMGGATASVANESRRAAIRPWVFLAPALFFLSLYLVYPVFATLWLSFFDAGGDEFVGFSNFLWALGDPNFQQSVFNNLLWLIVVPSFATAFGLVIAVMADKLWWGNIAKSLIFMPMAISFIGASVIWKFVYDYRSGDSEQIGILNAIVQGMGFEPQVWIQIPFWNNFFLMAILVWIQTGFAMVILSAALRGIPEETLEAARIDGANDVQIFFNIMIPQIFPTILVVWTTITILVLKVFDIVLAMTNGQWDTQVLANLMFDWMVRGVDFGRSSTIALVIMIAVLPIMIWNIRQANKEQGTR